MVLQVWRNFEKKRNSTKQPPEPASAVPNVTLKKDTSMLRPTFIISGEPETSLAQINYCAWASRYYYVTDVVYMTNNISEIKCEVDVLATYRGNILASTFYVERSLSNHNPWIPDHLLSQENRLRYYGHVGSTMSAGWDPVDGCFLVRVVGGGGTSQTGITTYAMTATGLEHLMQGIFNASNYEFLSDETIKSFFNPFQYIVSVMWFPLTVQTVASGTYQHIMLGWWDATPNGSYAVVNTGAVNLTATLVYPSILPNDWRSRSASWTNFKVFLPGAGTYFLNPAEVQGNIAVVYNIDIATGSVLITLWDTDYKYMIGSYTGMVASPVSIGQLDVNVGQTAKALVTGLGSLATGNLGGALGSALDVAINLAQPTPSVNGTNGNRAALVEIPSPQLEWWLYQEADFAATQIGYPTFKLLAMKDCTGFVKCANASISLIGTESEKNEVNAWLNGGFIIE